MSTDLATRARCYRPLPDVTAGEPHPNLYLEYAPRWMRPFDYYCYNADVLAQASDVRRQLLGHDFGSIEDGDLGYQQPRDRDVPLRDWLLERGLDVPALVGD